MCVMQMCITILLKEADLSLQSALYQLVSDIPVFSWNEFPLSCLLLSDSQTLTG